MTLTTLQETKDFLQVEGDGQDALITALLESLSAAAEAYTGRFIIKRSIEQEAHYIDSLCKSIQLNFYPAEAVHSVVQNGEVIDDVQIILDKQNGIIHKRGGTFDGGVLVSYRAGLAEDVASVPKDIKLAIWQWVRYMLSKSDGTVKSETLGDYSVSYSDLSSDMPELVTAILNHYRRYSI